MGLGSVKMLGCCYTQVQRIWKPSSMAKKTKTVEKSDSSATIGFEAKLWLTADKLRNNMDAAEYKHVVLGLIFLKYISDSFEEHYNKLKEGKGDYKGSDPEDKDEYKAENVFWVPKSARWSYLQANAKQPTIGKLIDDAMVAIERDNTRLKGSLNKNYGRADLDKNRLGELIDLIGSIQLVDAASRSKDVLGRVFEYFLTQFASAEGKNGGQFYTPSCVVRLVYWSYPLDAHWLLGSGRRSQRGDETVLRKDRL